MRVLLRDEKGFYYKAGESWTASPGVAVNFENTLVAMEFARENNFSKVEVVLWFNDPAYDISLPVRVMQGKRREVRSDGLEGKGTADAT